jgi:hypothetical protein
MAWTKPKDPLLSSPLYRRNRALLKRLRLPCAVCGKAIDYSTPGQFVAGHIVARWKAKRWGWPESQINSLQNLRPECKQCSHRTGAREGNQVKHAMRQRAKTGIIYQLDDHERW